MAPAHSVTCSPTRRVHSVTCSPTRHASACIGVVGLEARQLLAVCLLEQLDLHSNNAKRVTTLSHTHTWCGTHTDRALHLAGLQTHTHRGTGLSTHSNQAARYTEWWSNQACPFPLASLAAEPNWLGGKGAPARPSPHGNTHSRHAH